MGNKGGKPAGGKGGGLRAGQLPGSPGHAQAVINERTTPALGALVDDLSYDLWKRGAYGLGRGCGERYADGGWTDAHPAVERVRQDDATTVVLGPQGVVDTYGVYGMRWSSAVRPGTTFAVTVAAAELRSLTHGNYCVGLTPQSSFNPMQRPAPDAWRPTLILHCSGVVSVQGRIRQFKPWAANRVTIGFHLKCGSRPGRMCASVFVDDQPVINDLEFVPPPEPVHVFTFLNFVDDTAQFHPSWDPPHAFTARGPGGMPPGRSVTSPPAR